MSHRTGSLSISMQETVKRPSCQRAIHCAAAGDILEQAVFLSVRLQDEAAFERNYLQLKTYYTDTRWAPQHAWVHPSMHVAKGRMAWLSTDTTCQPLMLPFAHAAHHWPPRLAERCMAAPAVIPALMFIS